MRLFNSDGISYLHNFIIFYLLLTENQTALFHFIVTRLFIITIGISLCYDIAKLSYPRIYKTMTACYKNNFQRQIKIKPNLEFFS